MDENFGAVDLRWGARCFYREHPYSSRRAPFIIFFLSEDVHSYALTMLDRRRTFVLSIRRRSSLATIVVFMSLYASEMALLGGSFVVFATCFQISKRRTTAVERELHTIRERAETIQREFELLKLRLGSTATSRDPLHDDHVKRIRSADYNAMT